MKSQSVSDICTYITLAVMYSRFGCKNVLDFFGLLCIKIWLEINKILFFPKKKKKNHYGMDNGYHIFQFP